MSPSDQDSQDAAAALRLTFAASLSAAPTRLHSLAEQSKMSAI
jgi:hypothetical protein